MDSIGNLLTSIRNASAAGLPTTDVSYSKVREAVIKILKDNHYISDFQVSKEKPVKINIKLAYEKSDMLQKPRIKHISRISTPGRRVYVNHLNIPRPLRGVGMVVISTSKGITTGRDAHKNCLGGELICEVW